MDRIILGVAALLAGLYFAGCEVFGTYDFLLKDQGGVNYIVFAGSGIAAAVSLLPAWATLAWRGKPILSFAIWVLFWLSLVSVVGAAVWRTGTMTDIAQENRQKADDARLIAQRAETDARADVERAERALKEARADVVENAAKKTCAENCARLLGDAVDAAQRDLDTARNRLASARASLVAAPAQKTDSLSKRTVAVLPFLKEDQVRTYQPILVPALTSALSAALMALGIWAIGKFFKRAPKLETEPESAAKTPAAPEPLAVKQSADSGEPREPLAVNEVTASVEPVTPRPPVITQRATPLLQITGPGEKLVDFATACIERDAAAETHMRAARRAYVDFCADRPVEPLDLPAFAQELAALCKRTGIRVRVEGRDVFLGARLVN